MSKRSLPPAAYDTLGDIAMMLVDDYGMLLSAKSVRGLYQIGALKTYDYFLRVMERNARDLYSGKETKDEFINSLADLIQQQLTRAWNEGMRENGLDPQKDMTDAWFAKLQDIIANEYAYVDQFAADILAGARAGTGYGPFVTRASMWANRYNDVVNQAQLITSPADANYRWVYGDTVHCSTCARLNGIIATAKQWQDSGYQPQNPPNDALECGGWRCQCRLELTDDPPTKGGIPKI